MENGSIQSIINTLNFLINDQAGFCLWVGAGIGSQIGIEANALDNENQVSVPTWNELTTLGEKQINDFSIKDAHFPDRLENISRQLGLYPFQRFLRENTVDATANAIVKLAESKNYQTAERDTESREKFPIPDTVLCLAALGARCSSIVNFNIETYTSALIAGPTGSYNLLAATPPKPGGTDLQQVKSGIHGNGHENSPSFPRLVLHPHGAMPIYGHCVITKSDYESMSNSLSLELAVHKAFEQNLLILGMSLDDEYLRHQIEQFRNQMNDIIWITSESDYSKNMRWCKLNGIGNHAIAADCWDKFWRDFRNLYDPNMVHPKYVAQTWFDTACKAKNDLLAPVEMHYLAKTLRATAKAEVDGKRVTKFDGNVRASIIEQLGWARGEQDLAVKEEARIEYFSFANTLKSYLQDYSGNYNVKIMPKKFKPDMLASLMDEWGED